MEKAQAPRQPRQFQTLAQFFRQGIGEITFSQRPTNQFLQCRISQAGSGGVNRGHFLRQGFIIGHLAKAWMHHFCTEKTTAHFTKSPHPRPRTERRLLARVKTEETHGQLAARIERPHHHLAAWPELHFAGANHNLDLYGRPPWRRGNRYDHRFILIAQGQMHQQIGLAMEADFGELLAQGIGSANRHQRRSRHLNRAHWLNQFPRNITASASTSAPRGNSLTPTAARAGKGSLK